MHYLKVTHDLRLIMRVDNTNIIKRYIDTDNEIYNYMRGHTLVTLKMVKVSIICKYIRKILNI